MLGSNSRNEKQMQDERQGKMLLHTEFSLLSLLQNQPGVIQQHGMFSVSNLMCTYQCNGHEVSSLDINNVLSV